MRLNYNYQKVAILASVFITGGCVLIIEILALRILSPYYGNTIYTASAVISVVLCALSLGYYAGGKLADNRPSLSLFYAIIFAAGILTLLSEALGKSLLPELSPWLSLKSGPIISSLFLFFVPSFVLGLLSPFAIKLNSVGQNQIGRQSGEVFFWSTLGSIAGSLSCGFVLIPFFGVSAILIATGIALSLLGIIGVIATAKNIKKTMLMAGLLLATLLLTFFLNPKKLPGLVFEIDGVYEKIRVVDMLWQDNPARLLFQDRSFSAAKYLHSPELAFEYTKYYKLYELFQKKPSNALAIGGGAYSVPSAMLNEGIAVDVVEIEPTLLDIAKKYFDFRERPGFFNYIEDGRRFLAKNQKKYDIIFLDVYYSLFSVPMHFTTAEFFNLAKSRLSQNGIIICNFGGFAKDTAPSLTLSEIKTFKSLFDNSYFFAVRGSEYKSMQNIIFLGANDSPKIDFSSPDVLENPNTIIAGLQGKMIDTDSLDFSNVPILTDDYAPVEYLVGKVINRYK